MIELVTLLVSEYGSQSVNGRRCKILHEMSKVDRSVLSGFLHQWRRLFVIVRLQRLAWPGVLIIYS